jgi:hypothetical protein
MTMSPQTKHDLPPPLDLSGWRKLPAVLMVGGGLLSLTGAVVSPEEFGYSWLLSFMFFLTISIGALFLVMVHHLTDAGWSVATRRVCEHLGSMIFPWLAILFLPIALFAKHIYSWMSVDPATNTSVAAKWPVFTMPGFYITSAIFFALWWLLSSRLSYWSFRQDKTGEPLCTYRMRFHSGWGIVMLALTLTFSAALWMVALQYQWFSAVHGVYFFSICAWIALATVYAITALLQRQRILDRVLHDNQFFYLGLLFFAFTVFSAYNEFAQYFVVWNTNTPEETFWYLLRTHGSWWGVSMILIFGHFFVPFFLLLPVKAKTSFKIVLPVCVWAWLMHFLDLGFNILPASLLNQSGYPFDWIWLQLGCFAFMAGFLGWIFLKKLNAHAPFPLKDPRLHEAMGINLELDECADASLPAGGDE